MPELSTLLDRLSAAAPDLETSGTWPRQQLDWLAEAGVLGWVIPEESGGSDVSSRALIEGYEQLAAACLVTTFILTQRNGACQRIAAGESDSARRELLPDLAQGRLFATVGISHLSTSRQHLGKPVVTVVAGGDDLILSGDVPWVTGAPYADVVVTGGTLPDGRQMLIAVPMDAAGIEVQPAAKLLALTASHTAGISLDRVHVPSRFLLAGPVDGVMKRGQGGTGSVGTSALAMGLSQRAVSLLGEESRRRPELVPIVRSFEQELAALRTDLHATVDLEAEPDAVASACSPESIRQRANSLVLRSTQSLLAASKGAGFVAGHPAERSVREALFFLVWSCPQPIVAAALREFACLAE